MTGSTLFTGIEAQLDVHRIIADPGSGSDLSTIQVHGQRYTVVNDFQNTGSVAVHTHLGAGSALGHIVLPAAFTTVVADREELGIVRVAQDQTAAESHTVLSDDLVEINRDLQGCLGAAQEGLLAQQALAAPVVLGRHHVFSDQLAVLHTEEILTGVTGLVTGITDDPEVCIDGITIEVVFHLHAFRFGASHRQRSFHPKIIGTFHLDSRSAGSDREHFDVFLGLTFGKTEGRDCRAAFKGQFGRITAGQCDCSRCRVRGYLDSSSITGSFRNVYIALCEISRIQSRDRQRSESTADIVTQSAVALRSAGIHAHTHRDILAEIQTDSSAVNPPGIRGVGILHIEPGIGTIHRDAQIQITMHIFRKNAIERRNIITYSARIIYRIIYRGAGIGIVTPVAFTPVVRDQEPFGFIRRYQPDAGTRSGTGNDGLLMDSAARFHHQDFIRAGRESRHRYQ